MTTPGAALIWGPAHLAVTAGPAGPAWALSADWRARTGRRRVRVAYYGPELVTRVFPPGASDAEVAGAFGDDAVVVVEQHSAGLEATALPDSFVDLLWRQLPGIELLTTYQAVVRAVLLADLRPQGQHLPVSVVVQGTPAGPWILTFRGHALTGVRSASLDTLVADVTHTLSAVEYDPALDRVLATEDEADLLAPLVEVRRFSVEDLLGWLADADPDALPRFQPLRWHKRERLAARAPQRRAFLVGAVSAFGLAATAWAASYLARLRSEWQIQRLELERAQLEQEVRDLRTRSVGALLQQRQPRWGQVLRELAEACPVGIQLTELTIRETAGRRWAVRAVAVAVTGDAEATARLAEALERRLRATASWARAAVGLATTPRRDTQAVVTLEL